MNKYILRTITGRDGSDYLAVVYNGEFSENSPSIIGLQENNIEVMSDRLSAENTSVFLGPLKTNTPYTLKIYEDGNVQQTSFSTSDDCTCAARNIEGTGRCGQRTECISCHT